MLTGTSETEDCGLCYSKGSYVAEDIVAYPAHFDLPGPTVEFTAASEADLKSSHAPETTTNVNTTDAFDAGQHAQKSTASAAEAEADATLAPSHARDELGDFRNVWIAKPPPVMLKSHDGPLFVFPWRVFQSVEVQPTLLVKHNTHLLTDLRAGFPISPSTFRRNRITVVHGQRRGVGLRARRA